MLAGVIAIAVVMLAACNRSSTASTPTTYGGRVIDATSGTHVPSGRVTVDQENGTSLTARINTDGTFRITGEISSGEVIIDAPGYQRYRQSIDLRKTAWPEVFRVARASETPLLGRAIDEATSAPVTRGEVVWIVPGEADVVGRIEFDGSFRLDVPIAAETASGQLWISAPGYEDLRQQLDVRRGQGPIDFSLEPIPPTPVPTPRPTAPRRPTFELLGFYTGPSRTPALSQLTPTNGRISDCNPQALNAMVRVQNVPAGTQVTASWFVADQETPIATTTVDAATFTGSQLATSGLGAYGYRVTYGGETVAAGTVELRCP